MKKILIYSITLLISFISFSQSTEFEWVETFGSDDSTFIEHPYHMAVDSQGNIYTTGTFRREMDFDPGSGEFLMQPVPSTTSNNLFIQKLDPQGNFIWAKQLHKLEGPDLGTIGAKIEIDNNDNIILYRHYNEIWDLDPGPDEFPLGNIDNGENTQFFILKLNPDGDFIWAKDISGGVETENFIGIGDVHKDNLILDSNNNIHIVGGFSGTIDFDPSPNTQERTSHQNADGTYQGSAYALILDEAGNFINVNILIGEANSSFSIINTEENGNIVYAGIYGPASLDVDFGTDEFILPPTGTQGDLFILKTTLNHEFIWAKSLGSGVEYGFEYLQSLEVDFENNIILGGSFIGDHFDADPSPGTFILENLGSRDGFMIKFSTDGDLLWAFSVGSENQDRINKLALDNQGNITAIGIIHGTTDLDPTATEDFYTPVSNLSNLFIQQITPEGLYRGSTFYTFNAARIYAFDVEVVNDDDLLLYGFFKNTVDFDPSQDVYEVTSNGGSQDLFLLKLKQAILSVEEIETLEFAIYPNPSSGIFTVRHGNLDNIHYTITDVLGKIITRGFLHGKETQIDLSAVRAGIYFLNVGTQNIKLLKK